MPEYVTFRTDLLHTYLLHVNPNVRTVLYLVLTAVLYLVCTLKYIKTIVNMKIHEIRRFLFEFGGGVLGRELIRCVGGLIHTRHDSSVIGSVTKTL